MFIFDTRKLEIKTQQDYWQDAISQVFVPLNCLITIKENFWGYIKTRNSTNFEIALVKGAAQDVYRSFKNINSIDNDYILMSTLISGKTAVYQDEKNAKLNIGEFVFYDTQKPYRLSLEDDFEQIVTIFPRQEFYNKFGRIDKLNAINFGKSHPLQSLLIDYSKNLINFSNDLGLNTQDLIFNHYIDLIQSIIFDSLGKEHLKTNNVILLEIKRIINQNLSSPDLKSNDIASYLKISDRYLRKLFQDEQTTFSKFVLETRLKKCAIALAQNSNIISINEIAFKAGFIDMTYFSKCFKKHFGITPTEFRKENINNKM